MERKKRNGQYGWKSKAFNNPQRFYRISNKRNQKNKTYMRNSKTSIDQD